MFARKDLEHDVLSAYQRHRRNLKKARSGLNLSDSQQPRTLPVETARDTGYAGDAEGSLPTKSPRSDFDSSYTYKKIDTPIKERRSGNSDSQVEETMSRRHKAAAGEIEVHE